MAGYNARRRAIAGRQETQKERREDRKRATSGETKNHFFEGPAEGYTHFDIDASPKGGVVPRCRLGSASPSPLSWRPVNRGTS